MHLQRISHFQLIWFFENQETTLKINLSCHFFLRYPQVKEVEFCIIHDKKEFNVSRYDLQLFYKPLTT